MGCALSGLDKIFQWRTVRDFQNQTALIGLAKDKLHLNQSIIESAIAQNEKKKQNYLNKALEEKRKGNFALAAVHFKRFV